MILISFSRLLKTALFKYGVCSGFTYLLFIASVFLLHYTLGWTIFFSVALAHVLVAVCGFFLLRIFVFDSYSLPKEIRRAVVLNLASLSMALLFGFIIDANDLPPHLSFGIPWVTLLQNYIVARYYVWSVRLPQR